MATQKRARIDERDETVATLKPRACSECKKHKVKCERSQGQSTCIRCYRQGHKCVINSQLQIIIDEHTDWKRSATSQIKQLQAAVAEVLRVNGLPPLVNYSDHLASLVPTQVAQPVGASPTEEPTAMTRENSQDPDTEPELISAPMSSLYEVTKLRNVRSNLQSHPASRTNMLEEDFISRGVLQLREAESLFDIFNGTMNQFLWGGIALVHSDLASVRRSSSLLLAAIMTVAALHISDRIAIFNTCYTEFIAIVSSSTLNRFHTLDEIRGLAIGAFWLSDLCWKLSGHAVRIATELNLHQSLQKMLRGNVNHFEHAQLWYLLYVCDHHFSIAYGRPPVIQDSPAIQNYEAFLRSPSAGPGDVRMIIQVELFMILTKVYHAFGSDFEQALNEVDFARLRSFNVDVEQWRLRGEPRSADSPYVKSYPSKGVVLYYHFAKFQLNSLSLRAISPADHFSMTLVRKEAANIAITSAMAILSTVLYEPDIRNAIVGIPLFTHSMVAFASLFLLKILRKWKSASLNIHEIQVVDLVQNVIDLFFSVTASEKHLSYHIAGGLNKILKRYKDLRANQGGFETQSDGSEASALPDQLQFFPDDSFDTYGFEFFDNWDIFSSPVNFMPSAMPGN